MVAIVGGSELGLGANSGLVLGDRGQLGSASQGRSGEGVTVNAITGNLVLQRQDEFVAGSGADIGIVRTYNSLGLVNDDNGDNWRLGYSRKVYDLQGTAGMAGSSIKRLGEDGAVVTYNYDGARGLYVSTSGDGAFDTIASSAAQTWTWTDGSTQIKEIYDSVNGGRLAEIKDADGNIITIGYNASNLVNLITDQNGEKTAIDYSGNNITQIRTLDSTGNILLTRVRYHYDGYNRLDQVIVDLTPGNTSDSSTYVTNYTYVDINSRLISSVQQSDGSYLTFTYLQDGSNRIQTFSDYRGSNDIRTTSFNYDTANRQTLITDPSGRVTVWNYDVNNQVKSIQQLANNGANFVAQFDYDTFGNVIAVTDSRGNTVAYEYDNGNRILERDALGNTIKRQYGARNELLSETTYTGIDPDGAGSDQPSGAQTTYYLYETGSTRLRFIVSHAGRVTEYRYNGLLQRSAQISYALSTVAMSSYSAANPPTLSYLTGWVSGLGVADLAQSQRIDTAYDGRGLVNQVTTFAAMNNDGTGKADGTQSVTQYVYDQAGQLLSKIDARGTASSTVGDYITSYTYDGLGRLLTATDATSTPATPVTPTVYFYDDANRKTSVTLANGLLTTTTYDQAGLATAVVKGGGGNLGTTTYRYDVLGNLLQEIDPTGATTYHLYDAAGRKVGDIDPTGVLTEYVYNDTKITSTGLITQQTQTYSSDAVAMLTLSVTSPSIAGGGALSVVARTYADGVAIGSAQTALTAGVQGQLNIDVSLCDILVIAVYQGTTLIGEVVHTDIPALRLQGLEHLGAAGTGSVTDVQAPVTEAILSRAGDKVIKTIRHAEAVASGLLASAQSNPQALTLAAARPTTNTALNRATYQLYDNAGRLVKTIGATGAVVEYRYDGAGHLTDTIRYWTLLTTTQMNNLAAVNGYVAPNDSNVTPAVNAASDRLERRFYNADGLLRGELDGEGYLTEYRYNAAAQLIETIRYVTQTTSTDWATGTFALLLSQAAVPANASNDQHTHLLYDASARLIGEVKFAYAAGELGSGSAAQYYLTEYKYDVIGNRTSESRYATPIGYTTGQTIEQIRPANNGEDQKVSWGYDALNRKTSENRISEGIIINYLYNSVGNLIQTSRALATDPRVTRRRYDLLGRLTQELSAEGHVALSALSSPTQAQIDTVWLQYGTSYSYDLAGRVISKTEPIDAQGRANKTLYYYDADGRITHTVNARGEVSETLYNNFGDVASKRLYGTRISAATLAGLSGGLATSAWTNALAPLLLDPTKNSTETFAYNKNGQLGAHTDAQQFNDAIINYNAFGEESSRTVRTDAGNFRLSTSAYDRRGYKKSANESLADSITTQYVTDAFGRVTQVTDARNKVWKTQYDKLGRAVVVQDPTQLSNSLIRTTYDALDRTVSATDALGNTTTYSYNSASRSMTVSTPEGIQTTTTKNRYGQVISVKDGRNNVTTYAYDVNGRLKSVTPPAGTTNSPTAASTNTYDRAGHLIDSVDANNVTTHYIYDAAGRAISRTVDPSGLNLTTLTVYDAKGEAIWAQDAKGVWTQTQYDGNGRVLSITVDPLSVPQAMADGSGTVLYNANGSLAMQANWGLALETAFTYDGQGHTLTVTRGVGSANPLVTKYVYDRLGRRTEEHVDPVTAARPAGTALDITTVYRYDKNNNVVAKVDANIHITRYVYDDANRLLYSVDATGAVVKTDYDAEGRVIQTTAYADRIDVASLGQLEISAATLIDPTTGKLKLANANYATNVANQLTKTVYDNDGRAVYNIDGLNYVTQRKYDKAGNVIQTIRYNNAIGLPALPLTKDNLATAITAADTGALNLITSTVYDAANRAIWSIDAKDYATQWFYDKNGAVIKERHYAKALLTPFTPDSIAATAPAPTADNNNDKIIRHFYDNAGNERFTVDGEGYVTEQQFDNLGRQVYGTQYITNFGVGSERPIIDGDTTAILAAYFNGIGGTDGDVVKATLYDNGGRLETEIKGDSSGYVDATTHQYDAAGRETDTISHYTFSSESTTHRVYDAAGRLTDEYQAYGTPEQTHTRYVLDNVGNRLQIIDPRGMELIETDSEWAKATRFALGYVSGGVAKLATSLSSLEKDQLLTRYTTTQQFDDQDRLTLSTDALGGAMRKQYDVFGNVVKIIDPNDNVGYFYFDADNRAQLQIDPEGYATRFEYDAFDRLTTQTRFYTRVNAGYSTGTSLATMLSSAYLVTTPGKDISTITMYDRRGDVKAIYDALSVAEFYSYDAFRNKIQFTDRRGSIYNYEYNRKDQLIRETSPAVAVVTVDANRNITTASQAIANEYEYDARGNLILFREAVDTSQVRQTTTFYDGLDRAIRTNLPFRQVFNGTANVLTMPFTKANYDSSGNKVEEWDANNKRTLHYYDALNRQIAQVDADGTLHEYQYDAAGNLIQERTYGAPLDVANLVWTARPSAAVNDSYREMRYGYNANNLQTSSATQVETSFDPDNLRFSEEGKIVGGNGYIRGAVITYSDYDANGNVIQTMDGRGFTTHYFYNKLGQQTLVLDALGYLTQREYDSAGHVIRESKYAQQLPPAALAAVLAVIDPNGTVNPSGTAPVTLYCYDAQGYLSLSIDALGYVNLRIYDGGSAPTVYQYPQPLSSTLLAALLSPDAQRHLDINVLVNAVKNIGQDRVVEFDYNVRGQKIAERALSVLYTTVSANGTPTTQEAALQTDYGYDANGNMLWKHSPNKPLALDTSGNPIADEALISYQYDALNRLIQQLDPQAKIYTGMSGSTVQTVNNVRAKTEWRYDFLGRINQETRFGLNDLSSDDDQIKLVNYDLADNTRSEWDAENNRTNYDVDAVGNVLRRTRYSIDADFFVNGFTHTYQTYFYYDAKGRETSRQIITDKGVALRENIGDTTFTRYNTYGDITASGVKGITQHQYRYDKLGRLFWSNAETGTPTVYLYDANGNAVLEVKAVDQSLQVDNTFVANLNGLTSPEQVRAFSPEHVQMKYTVYDARNQATNVFQTPMIFDKLTGGLELGIAQSDPIDPVLKPKPGPSDILKTVTVANNAQSNSNYYSPPAISTNWGTQIYADDAAHDDNIERPPAGNGNMSPATNDDGYASFDPGKKSNLTTRTTWWEPVVEKTAKADLPPLEHKEVTNGNVTTITDKVYTKKTITVKHSYSTESATQVLETIETTTVTEATITTKVITRTDNVIDYSAGTVTGGNATTVTTDANSSNTETTTAKRHHQMSYTSTRVDELLGGQDTRQTNLQFFEGQYIPVRGGGGPTGVTRWFDIPVIAFGGNYPVVVRLEKNGVLYKEESYTQATTFIVNTPSGETAGVVYHFTIKKNGFTLLDKSFTSQSGTGGAIFTNRAVTISNVNDNTAKAILFTSSTGNSSDPIRYQTLTRRATGGSWDGVIPNSVEWPPAVWPPADYTWPLPLPPATSPTMSWGYNLLSKIPTSIPEALSQTYVIGHVEGSDQHQPTVRRMQWTTHTETIYKRSYFGSNGQNGGGEFIRPTLQSEQQSNYLQHLMFSLHGTPAENIIHREQTYNAFGEIVSEIIRPDDNPLHVYVTKYDYNELGKLIKKIDPGVAYTDENGFEHLNHTPTTTYYIDALGQTVGQQDDLGFNTTQQYANGHLIKQFNPDWYQEYYYYDVFGNLAAMTNAAGKTTRHQYNKNNQITRTDFAGGNFDIFALDSFGQRISHTNGLGDIERYLFDGEGRITQYISYSGYKIVGGQSVWVEGRKTTYTYSFQPTIGESGGYRKTTTDPMLTGLIDDVDVFGKVRSHTDLSGRVYTYSYNDAGWLTKQVSITGQNIDYTYYRNGYLRSIVDHGIQSEAQFQYDKDGNRIYESYGQVGATVEEYGYGLHMYQMASTTYDALNRITSIFESGAFKIDYKYDKVGNRRNVHSAYWDLLHSDTAAEQDFWYKYDAMNRFTTTMGKLEGNQIVRDSGYEISYNGIGQRMTQKTTSGNFTITESYQYDDNGFLTKVKIDPGTGAAAKVRSRRFNDNIGVVFKYEEYNNDENGTDTGSVVSRHLYEYDKDHIQTKDTDDINHSGLITNLRADGNIDFMVTFNAPGNNAPTVRNEFTYEKWDSYLQSTNTVIGITNQELAYRWANGVSKLTYDENGHVEQMYDKYTNKTTQYVNNQNGQTLKRLNFDGDITQLVNQKPTVIRQFYYFNGKAIGDQGSDHNPSVVDYAQTLRAAELEGENNKVYIKQQRIESMPAAIRYMTGRAGRNARSAYVANAGRVDNYQYHDIGERVIPVSSVDFDQNFLPINRDYPARTPGNYIVKTGDTWQQIAAAVWGDSSLWYLLADANSDAALTADVRLTIPNVVTNIHNNSTTFRVFEPGLTLGDIQPTLPPMPPPPKPRGSCGALAQIITMVVAVVVSVITAGAASPLVAMAIGALSSVATQGLLIAAGLQEKFSWQAVAMAAIGGGISAGVGSLGVFADSAWGFAQAAAVSSIATQGVGVALGLQKKFSWTQVAVSAASAGVSYAIGDAIGNAQYGSDAWNGQDGVDGIKASIGKGLGEADFGNSFVRNTASSFARGATTNLLTGQHDWAGVAAQSFGQGLGNALVSMQRYGDQQRVQQQQLREKQAAEAKKDYADSAAELSRSVGNDIENTRASNASELAAMNDRNGVQLLRELNDAVGVAPKLNTIGKSAVSQQPNSMARVERPVQAESVTPVYTSTHIDQVVVEAHKIENPLWSTLAEAANQAKGDYDHGASVGDFVKQILDSGSSGAKKFGPETLLLSRRGGVTRLPGVPESFTPLRVSTKVENIAKQTGLVLRDADNAIGSALDDAAQKLRPVAKVANAFSAISVAADATAYYQTGDIEYAGSATNTVGWAVADKAVGAGIVAGLALVSNPIGWGVIAVGGISYSGARIYDAFQSDGFEEWTRDNWATPAAQMVEDFFKK